MAYHEKLMCLFVRILHRPDFCCCFLMLLFVNTVYLLGFTVIKARLGYLLMDYFYF